MDEARLGKIDEKIKSNRKEAKQVRETKKQLENTISLIQSEFLRNGKILCLRILFYRTAENMDFGEKEKSEIVKDFVTTHVF